MWTLFCVLRIGPHFAALYKYSLKMEDEWESQDGSEAEIENYFMKNIISTRTFGCLLMEVDVHNMASLYKSDWTRGTFFSNQFITPKHQVIFLKWVNVNSLW